MMVLWSWAGGNANPSEMRPLITLLTDFGTADGYVAEMKGVLYSLAPEARVVDLTRDRPAGCGKRAVGRCAILAPISAQNLHLASSIPESVRRATRSRCEARIACSSGPTMVRSLPRCSAGRGPSRSPCGRGITDLSRSRSLRSRGGANRDGRTDRRLGPPAESPTIRRTPEARRLGNGAIQGEVISIDRYGNAITNIVAFPATQGREGEQNFVEIGGRTVPVARAYADVQPLGAVALCGSSGLLEIAVRDGNAAQSLSLTRGSVVTLHGGHRG